MSSLARVFDILDLISVDNPVLQVEQISSRLRYTRATGYRYVRALCDAGILVSNPGGGFVLGPRILELERLQHLSDPLLHACSEPVARLAEELPTNALLVCSAYADKVMCIHQDGAEHFTIKGEMLKLQRSRGIPFSLFAGAASLAILANFPTHRLRTIYLNHEKEILNAGLATSWPEFRQQLAQKRKAGYVVTIGNMNVHLAAIGAPIFGPDGQVAGSVTRVVAREEFALENEIRAAARITECAKQISERLAAPAPAIVENVAENAAA